MNEIHDDCLPEVSNYLCSDDWTNRINEINFAGAFLLGFALIVILQNISYRYKSDKVMDTNLPDIVSSFTAISLAILIAKLVVVQPPYSEKLPFYFTYVIITMPITQAAYAAVGHTWNNISKSKKSQQAAVRAQARTMGIIVFLISISSLTACRWSLMRAIKRNDEESIKLARYATMATYAFLNLITFGYLYTARNTMVADLKRIEHAYVRRQLTRMLNLALFAAIFAMVETASLILRELLPHYLIVHSICLMLSYISLTFFCSQWQMMFAASHSKGIERFSPFTVVIGADSTGMVDNVDSVVEWNEESVPELRENRQRKIKKKQQVQKAQEEEEIADLVDPYDDIMPKSPIASIRNAIQSSVSHTFRFSATNLKDDDDLPDIIDAPDAMVDNSNPFENSDSKEGSDPIMVSNQYCFSKKQSQAVEALGLDDFSDRASTNRHMAEGSVVVAGGRTSDIVPERRRSLHAGQESQLQRARESLQEEERQKLASMTRDEARMHFFHLMSPNNKNKGKRQFLIDRSESASPAHKIKLSRPVSARISPTNQDLMQRPGSARLSPKTSMGSRQKKRPTPPDHGFHTTRSSKSTFDTFLLQDHPMTTTAAQASPPRPKKGIESLFGSAAASRPPSGRIPSAQKSPQLSPRSPRSPGLTPRQSPRMTPRESPRLSPRGSTPTKSTGSSQPFTLSATNANNASNDINSFVERRFNDPTARLTASSTTPSIDKDISGTLSHSRSENNRYSSPAVVDFGNFEYTDEESFVDGRRSEGISNPTKKHSDKKKSPPQNRPTKPSRRKSGVQTLKDMFQPKNMDFGGLWLDHIDKAIEDEVFHLQEYIRLSRNVAKFWKVKFSCKDFVSFPNPVNVAEIRILAAINVMLVVACIIIDVNWRIKYPYFFIVFCLSARALFGPRLDVISHLVLFGLMPLLVNRFELLDDDFSAGPPARFSLIVTSIVVIAAVVIRFVLEYYSNLEFLGVMICAIMMSAVAMISLVEVTSSESPANGIFMWLIEHGYASDDVCRACSIHYKSARHRLNLGVMGKYQQQKQLKRMDTIARALDIVNTAASVLSPINIIPKERTAPKPLLTSKSTPKDLSPKLVAVRPEKVASEEKKANDRSVELKPIPVNVPENNNEFDPPNAIKDTNYRRVIKAALSSRRLESKGFESEFINEFEIVRGDSMPKYTRAL